ncbi:MAG TPA: fibronectin type III domain-containing protein [Flavobacteriales bacterium]|nr:fibronectin type III domain-containing protein [Flavobacteriales bacterium]
MKRHKPGESPQKTDQMKNVYYIVKLGLDRITPSALLVKARNMVTQMTGNASFTTPVPPLATVTTAGDALEAAINAHDLNPGPSELIDRNLAFENVKGLLVDLSGYVQAASGGDLDKIKSAGCAVRKSNSPIGQLPAPRKLLAITTRYPGRIEVQWGGVRGRNTYSLEICVGDPNVEANWSLLALTSKNRYTADALESDKVYYFRVTAIGAAGASPVSDQANAKAA